MPDRRLVTGATGTLAAPVDAPAAFLPLDAAAREVSSRGRQLRGPRDGAPRGRRVDFRMASGRSAPPFGFSRLPPRLSWHQAGRHTRKATASHIWFVRSAITCTTWTRLCWTKSPAHFAAVANACGIDMIYFDGSEATARRPLVLQCPAAQGLLRQTAKQGHAAPGQQLQPLLLAPDVARGVGRRPRRPEGLSRRTFRRLRRPPSRPDAAWTSAGTMATT